MTAAKELAPRADPVRAPTPDRLLTAEQHAEVERALAEIAESRFPPLSSEGVRLAIEDRLRAEQEALATERGELSPEGGLILSPEDEAELVRVIAETDEDERAGKTITWEQLVAGRELRRAG